MAYKTKTDDILKSFDRISRQDWISRIVSDLKGKTLDMISYEPEPGLVLSPFVHDEDVSSIGKNTHYNPEWQIVEELTVAADGNDNSRIIEALEGGAQVLLLKTISIVDWASILKNVDMRLVGLRVECPWQMEPGVEAALSEYTSRHYPEDHLDWSVRSGTPCNGIHCKKITNQESTPSALASAMAGLLDDLENITEHLQIEFIVEIGTDAVFEISRLKALKMIWDEISLACGLDRHSAILEVQFKEQVYTEDIHANMIRASSMAFAAVCGGADRLSIMPAGGKDDIDPQNRRIARNIHHLLKYEGGFDRIPDPVQGAHFFEKASRMLFDATWEMLKRV